MSLTLEIPDAVSEALNLPPAELKARIAEAATIVPLERLALSSQCGFASTHEGNRLTEYDQRRKLELVANTAKEVWG